MILTNRDSKWLNRNHQKFLEPKAGYELPQVCEEEEKWQKFCQCKTTVIRRKAIGTDGSYIKPCSKCGRKIKDEKYQ